MEVIKPMRKAFDDIVVLDFTRYLTGPYASYMLGLMGAYIIKVEKPYVGEDMRQFPPFYNGESIAYGAYAANKHSLCLNMRDEKAKEILKGLLPHVDILMQNFRSGTIEKMGLDWDTVHEINPRLIMANFSAYGQYGPYSKRLAFDSIIQSECGMISTICDESGGKPYYPGGDNSGFAGALCFAGAIAAAINERDRTGEGSYLDIDMMSSVVSMFSPEFSLAAAAGASMKTHDFAPHAFYHDKSGRHVQISCPDALWEKFKSVTNDSALENECFSTLGGRRENKAALDAIIEEWSIKRSAEEICTALEAKCIGAGIVRDYKDLPANEHIKAAGLMQPVNVPFIGEVSYPRLPFTLSASPAEYGKISTIGEDNYEVLHKFLGKTKSDVDAFLKDGILYQSEHSRIQP